jgi:hypothetical protein
VQILNNIDVDDLERAPTFYLAAFELRLGRRLGADVVELGRLLAAVPAAPGGRHGAFAPHSPAARLLALLDLGGPSASSIDARRLNDQGIERKAAVQMERRGIVSKRGSANRQVVPNNREREELLAQLAGVKPRPT